MALTRAQYLAGNTADGVVLTGQPQGVRQGTGITIAANGVISVNGNDPLLNSLVKTNSATAYNAYVWPNGIPVTTSTLGVLTTNQAGTLSWIDPYTIGGVTRIIAGTNISISPVTGLGDVTINNDGGQTFAVAPLVSDLAVPSTLSINLALLPPLP